jgi:hypothetical protein
MSEELEFEPIPGLPHALPAGEQILWQGQPDWRSLAQHTFHLRWLYGYFGVFAAARGVAALHDGVGLASALWSSLMVLPLSALCIGVLSLLSWVNARATIYTITSRRVVLRCGVALPVTFNLPFKRLAEATLLAHKNGTGDIALRLVSPDRIGWLHLWPHARPWHLAKAQPMLRCIPDAKQVAATLADAVAQWSVQAQASVLLGAPSVAPESAARVPTPRHGAVVQVGKQLAEASH